jgi:hypothetical protein
MKRLIGIETVDLEGGKVVGEPQEVWINPGYVYSISKNRATLNCWVLDLGAGGKLDVTRDMANKLVNYMG